MSASILSRVSRKQNHSSLQGSNQNLKFKKHRILKPTEFSNMTVFDDRQISEQITKEMYKIDQTISKYRQQMKQQGEYRRIKKDIYQETIDLQKIIRQKDNEIKSINGEIQILKGLNTVHEPLKNIRQSVLSPSPDVFTLAEQLKNEAGQLRLLIEDHSQKAINHKMLYMAVKQIEKVFKEKHPKVNISYEKFKEQSEDTRKEQQERLKKRESRVPTFKERIETIIEPSVMRGDVEGKGGIKHLLEKKKKVKMAIKNAKKKHLSDIMDLNAKLQFLRDEDALLNEQISEKQSQKSHLQQKFNLNVRNRLKQKSRVSQGQTVVKESQYF